MSRERNRTTESSFQRSLIDDLEEVGARILVVHGHAFQRRGWPDIQVYHTIWTGHLENKVESGDFTDLQRIVMRRLVSVGTPAFGCVYERDVDRLVLTDDKDTILSTLDDWDVFEGESRGLILLKELAGLSQEIWTRSPSMRQVRP